MFKQKLRNLLAANETQKVIEQLLKITQLPEHKGLNNEVVIQAAKYAQFRQEKGNDIVSKEEERLTMGRIRMDLLFIIDRLGEDDNKETSKTIENIPNQLPTKKEKDRNVIQNSEKFIAGDVSGGTIIFGDNISSNNPKKD